MKYELLYQGCKYAWCNWHRSLLTGIGSSIQVFWYFGQNWLIINHHWSVMNDLKRSIIYHQCSLFPAQGWERGRTLAILLGCCCLTACPRITRWVVSTFKLALYILCSVCVPKYFVLVYAIFYKVHGTVNCWTCYQSIYIWEFICIMPINLSRVAK